MSLYSIKVPTDDVAVRMPFSMTDGDSYIIIFKNKAVLEHVANELQNLLQSGEKN